MALQQTVNRQRSDSPARWQAAFQRAVDNAIDLFAVAGLPDTFAVSSVSDPGLVHLTTATTCSCKAAQAGDAVCLHRAAVRTALGVLPAVVPTVAPEPVRPAARVACPVCREAGWQPKVAGDARPWIPYEDRQPCPTCHGCGTVRPEPARPVALLATTRRAAA